MRIERRIVLAPLAPFGSPLSTVRSAYNSCLPIIVVIRPFIRSVGNVELSYIVSSGELGDVASLMLLIGFVIGIVMTPFQHRPEQLNPVDKGGFTDVFLVLKISRISEQARSVKVTAGRRRLRPAHKRSSHVRAYFGTVHTSSRTTGIPSS